MRGREEKKKLKIQMITIEISHLGSVTYFSDNKKGHPNHRKHIVVIFILAFLCFWVKIVVRPGVRSRWEASVLVSVGGDTLQPIFITVFKAVTQSLD